MKLNTVENLYVFFYLFSTYITNPYLYRNLDKKKPWTSNENWRTDKISLIDSNEKIKDNGKRREDASDDK